MLLSSNLGSDPGCCVYKVLFLERNSPPLPTTSASSSQTQTLSCLRDATEFSSIGKESKVLRLAIWTLKNSVISLLSSGIQSVPNVLKIQASSITLQNGGSDSRSPTEQRTSHKEASHE